MERVTSLYAENCFTEDYCGPVKNAGKGSRPSFSNKSDGEHDDWISPSDLLTGIVDLKPPFTSKITRGKAHEGILAIGNKVLEREHAKFLARLKSLIEDNEASWKYILEQEKEVIQKKVSEIHEEIFQEKSKIMMKEVAIFYENSLQEVENHVRSELQNVITSNNSNAVNYLNKEIQRKMKKENEILENNLLDRYNSEIKKIKTYYDLLLRNQVVRSEKLINSAIFQRNDALKAFYKQFQSESITGTMYVMCTERKKCKVRQFLLENYQNSEILKKTKMIQDKQESIDKLKEREMTLVEINKKWEEKIQKILKIFLKFISFSLKLLPEQTTFLLDLQKMFILQLNEILKRPKEAHSILIDEKELEGIFHFEELLPEETICDKEPFVIVGDTSIPPLPRYGSRETLPSDVELPLFRLQRQFVYAECHKFEEIKAFLKSQICSCHQLKSPEPLDSQSSSKSTLEPNQPSHVTESSNTTFLIDDINRLDHCPARTCKQCKNKLSFPYIYQYLDFTEENFARVKAILSTLSNVDIVPKLLDPKEVAYADLLFGETNEPRRDIATQYSSQEDLRAPDVICECIEQPIDESLQGKHISFSQILSRRRDCVIDVLQNNPKLHGFFTEECFDFQF